jgi:hypothetical protein
VVEADIERVSEKAGREPKAGAKNSNRTGSKNRKVQDDEDDAGIRAFDLRVMEFMADAMKLSPEDYIVAHLQEPCSHCHKHKSDEDEQRYGVTLRHSSCANSVYQIMIRIFRCSGQGVCM